MFPSPDRLWRRIAEDIRQPQKHRIAALNRIARPSLSMLRRLVHQSTPPKLRFRACQLFEIAIARKELNATRTPPNSDSGPA
jgi:hypothetical protein